MIIIWYTWWIVHRIAARSFFAIDFSNLIQLYAENESRPLVGSSRNNKDGFVTISTPTEVRLRWPPDIPLINSPPISTNDDVNDDNYDDKYKNSPSAQSSIPSSCRVLSTNSLISSLI